MKRNIQELEDIAPNYRNNTRRLRTIDNKIDFEKIPEINIKETKKQINITDQEYLPYSQSQSSWEEMFEAETESEDVGLVSSSSNSPIEKKKQKGLNQKKSINNGKLKAGALKQKKSEKKQGSDQNSSRASMSKNSKKNKQSKNSEEMTGTENSERELETDDDLSAPENNSKAPKGIIFSKNLEELIKNIEEYTKSSIKARKDEKGKLRKNVANFGGKKFEYASVLRGGEYSGFTVQFLENTRPLLNDARIINGLRYLQKEDYQMCIKTFEIQKEHQEFGLKIIYYVLKKWLLKNKFGVPEELKKEDLDSLEIQSVQNTPIMLDLNKWINTCRHDPINAIIKISNIGQSKKGHSVVPEEWLGREFSNAAELHSEMDKLEWRMGKPPVNFCAIYSMAILESNKWIILDSLGNSGFLERVKKRKPKYVITLSVKGDSERSFLLTSIKEIKGETDARVVWDTRPEHSSLIETSQGNSTAFLISQNELIFEAMPNFVRTENVGLLVSCLQKSVRRGSKGFKILHDCILNLRNSPPYNLPNQQFLKVSATRQLFWRLFITIIEDACPYLQNPEINDYLSLQDLFCLAVAASADPDLQINDFILRKVINTAMHVQSYDSFCWNWRKGDENLKAKDFLLEEELQEDSEKVKALKRVKNALKCALEMMVMMAGDKTMLQKSISYLNSHREEEKYISFPNIEIEKALNKSDKITCQEINMASHDIHCFPNITLHLQGTLPFLPKESCSTKNLSKYIWDQSSSYNIRYHKKEVYFKFSNKEEELKFSSLQSIQLHMSSPAETEIKLDEGVLKLIKHNSCNIPNTKGFVAKLTPLVNRTAFQCLFGQKVRIPSEKSKEKTIEVIISGSEGEPCRVKQGQTADRYSFLQGKERYLGERRYVLYMEQQKTEVDVPEPPVGFEWVFKNKKKVKIGVELVKDYPDEYRNDLLFSVDEFKLKPFDASFILIPLEKIMYDAEIPEAYLKLLKESLYYKVVASSYFELNLLMRKIAKERNLRGDYHLYDWRTLAEKSPELTDVVWKHVLVRLHNNFRDQILVGPVDRSGNKLQNSISYLYEGVIWRIYNMLSMLYPRVLQPSGEFKFHLRRTFSEYQDLVDNLCYLCHCSGGIQKKEFSFKINKDIEKIPTIKTNLWEHQASTVDRMTEGYIASGKLGFGDASCVGAGKTLTAISVMQKLVEHNVKNKINNFKGFAVLLPTQKLFQTWRDEILKHTNGFLICEQEANGAHKPITYNTILITTLGRMRDHPIYNSWQLVVIDECLSVQNREALQTEEAWRQATISQFGVLMMSATFFRSRFDKMFFMLKMLRSGLPEVKEFLDCILGESMICFIAEKSRKWLTNCFKFPLDHDLRSGYTAIMDRNLSAERTYGLLSEFLYKNFDLASHLQKLINKLEANDQTLKGLIYARSKDEADYLAKYLKNVSRYPDKSKRHVVVAFSEATYGLNDLVIYNTIITRPPEPDKLPQIKGRLDRPGQKEDVLRMEYFLIENTIEEALLLRLEIANKFMNDYIMPLAKFYEVAVGKDSDLRF